MPSACGRTSTRCASASPPPAREPAATPAEVELLAATKYVPLEQMGALAEAGIELVGENTAQDLAAKQERWGDALHVRLHRPPPEPQDQGRAAARAPDPLGRERVGRRRQIERHAEGAVHVLLEVNVAGEQTKHGVAAGRGRRVPRAASGGRARRASRAHDDAAACAEPEQARPYFAAPARAGGAAARRLGADGTTSGCSRWAPARTSRWPSRRAPPSCRLGSVLYA